jgi:hypothetical protein
VPISGHASQGQSLEVRCLRPRDCKRMIQNPWDTDRLDTRQSGKVPDPFVAVKMHGIVKLFVRVAQFESETAQCYQWNRNRGSEESGRSRSKSSCVCNWMSVGVQHVLFLNLHVGTVGYQLASISQPLYDCPSQDHGN